MAFNFVRSKKNLSSSNLHNDASNQQQSEQNLPKLTATQLGKLAKTYPSWLRDSGGSSLKQLPGVYHGVLGQVQLQPEFVFNGDSKIELVNIKKQQTQADYMNKFTDTERVHQLLSASRLPNEVLATIWAHVNKTFPGRLTNREVCLALALIAIFQRLQKDGQQVGGQTNDPFTLVKAEKKPPVPTLYPNTNYNNNNNFSPTKSRFPASNSIPNDLSSSGCLLIDLQEDEGNLAKQQDPEPETKHSESLVLTNSYLSTTITNTGANISLIDSDRDKFLVRLTKLTQVWLQMMITMRNIFKRSFDILNVENSRQSAIEALNSPKGLEFSKNLCLCYPIAHNIKFKIDELANFGSSSEGAPKGTLCLLDKKYVTQINDLMISINEYWAVLINLFHESGQTCLIELVMDGLNYNTKTVIGQTLDELALELDNTGKPDVCAICHTKFYLASVKSTNSDEYDELINDQKLLTLDNCNYYHVKCANFWTNTVAKTDKLPFHNEADDILRPSNN